LNKKVDKEEKMLKNGEKMKITNFFKDLLACSLQFFFNPSSSTRMIKSHNMTNNAVIKINQENGGVFKL
jgi:hypothetical protein